MNKVRDGTRWIPPCLFLLFHKACWQVKRLAITCCRVSPRLSRLNVRALTSQEIFFSLASYFVGYFLRKRHTMIQTPASATDLMQFFALCAECSHLLCGVAVESFSKEYEYDYKI